MKHKNSLLSLATLGSVGYLPASGTLATLCTIPVIYFFSFIDLTLSLYAVIVGVFTMFAFKIVGSALQVFRQRDPSEIVLDEVVGCLIVFFAVPISFSSLVAGFFLFRLFDIFKPFGIKKCELLYGSLGVMMDDILSGILANVVLRLALHYF